MINIVTLAESALELINNEISYAELHLANNRSEKERFEAQKYLEIYRYIKGVLEGRETS